MCVGAAVAVSVSKPLNSKEKVFLVSCYSFKATNTVNYPCLSLHLNLCFMSCAVQKCQNQKASFLFPDCSKSLAAANHSVK